MNLEVTARLSSMESPHMMHYSCLSHEGQTACLQDRKDTGS